MYEGLKGQVAVITGGASGLGLSIARALAAHGVKLALIDRNQAVLDDLKKDLSFSSWAIDVTREEEVVRAVAEIAASFGRIDILINSAGVTGKTNVPSHETDPDDVRKVFDINFMGSYLTSRYCLPVMLSRQYGRILHIASIAGKEGNAGMLAYSASKAAVIGMAKVQGKEYAETGVTVNALAPAVIQTAMVDAMPPEQVKYMTDKIPMKRCGSLEEIAGIALYIVSPQNSFSTGFTFDLSGGRATY
jgi:NAD(P)-dependent dehydrogenase (short-subunit alcohol dehydrogenase family)